MTATTLNPSIKPDITVKTILRQLVWRLIEAHRIRTERMHLAGLSDDMLRDIGVDRTAAEKESARKFTDLPVNRQV